MSEAHLPPGPPTRTPVADDLYHALDPRYITLSRIVGGIITACIFLGTPIACLVLVFTDLPAWVPWLALLAGLATTAFLGWVFYRWPVLEHRHHAYRVNTQGIEIRQGVWWRKAISVPRSRVQHTDVSQGPLERRFDLATLHIHTAGTDQAQVDLPGVQHATALAIRDHLVAVGDAGGSDDAV